MIKIPNFRFSKAFVEDVRFCKSKLAFEEFKKKNMQEESEHFILSFGNAITSSMSQGEVIFENFFNQKNSHRGECGSQAPHTDLEHY